MEAQYNSRPDYLDRVLYYSYWPVMGQIRSGKKNNYKLSEVYVLSFTNFALDAASYTSGKVQPGEHADS